MRKSSTYTESTYTNIKACKKCNGTAFLKNGRCKECMRVVRLAYYARNKKSILERAAVFYANNVDRLREKSATYKALHREESRAYAAAYSTINAEKILATSAAYRMANALKLKIKHAAYRVKNAAKIDAVNAKWKLKNPQAVRAHHHNRRARKLEVGGTISSDLVARLFSLQKGKCLCCGKPLGSDFHLDHSMPLALGGANGDSNMQLLRKSCNLQKSSTHPVDFMQSRGFLL